jgi:hypothetical protein
MSVSENAYIGRDNVTKRVLRIDGALLTSGEQQAIERVVVNIGTYCLDTDDGINITYDAGVISMTIGLIDGIRAGEYTAKITVYDSVLTNGKAWDSFKVMVYPWNECDTSGA